MPRSAATNSAGSHTRIAAPVGPAVKVTASLRWKKRAMPYSARDNVDKVKLIILLVHVASQGSKKRSVPYARDGEGRRKAAQGHGSVFKQTPGVLESTHKRFTMSVVAVTTHCS